MMTFPTEWKNKNVPNHQSEKKQKRNMGMAPKNDPRNVQQIQRLNMNYFVSIEIHLSQTPGLRIHPWPESGKKKHHRTR
jgi:hypothetical protein